MDSSSVLAPPSSWEEDRKFVLRAWCLVFSILATLMALTMMDGRMAYMQGSHTGYVGIWIDCRKHQCAIPGQVTVAVVRRTSCCDWLDLDHMLFLKVSGAVPSVRSTRTDGGWRLPPNKIELLLPEEQERMLVLIHMSMGCMMLALMLCLVLLLTMGISFWPVFRRLNKIDLVFSSLSFSVGKCQLGGRGALPPQHLSPGLSFRLWGGVSQSFCPAGCWVSVFECLLGSLLHLSLVHLFYFIFLSRGVRGVSHFAMFPSSFRLFAGIILVYRVCVVCVCVCLSWRRGEDVSVSSLSASPGVPVQPRVRLWPHPSAGFLIVLSLTLFVVNCETLRPRPQPPPPGTLSYLNQVGMWSKGTYSRERRVSRRRVTTQSTPRHVSDQQSDADP
nr:uncharacterized protein LOC123281038 isoform X2 [Equus asinus]